MSEARRINGKIVHTLRDDITAEEALAELMKQGDPTVELPKNVNGENPLQLFIGRPVLEAILEDNIAAIVKNRPELDRDGESKETDAMMTERQDFLRWVRAHPGVNIYMSIHPIPEYPELDLPAPDA